MEIVKLANRTKIHGNCSIESVRDTYLVEIRGEDMFICIVDNGMDMSTSVCLEQKDAIKLAKTILKHYGEDK